MKVCLEPDGGSKKMKEKKYMQWTIETEKNVWKNTPVWEKGEENWEIKTVDIYWWDWAVAYYGKIMNWKKNMQNKNAI